MDINDFQHNFKYKLFIPFLYIINWGAMFLGPSFFPVIYQRYCLFFMFYLLVKTTVLLIGAISGFVKGLILLHKVEKSKSSSVELRQELQPNQSQIYYAFIIPSYKEDLDLLADTLQHLADHTRAKNRYIVFLAMEAHEEKSDEKATFLIKKFEDKFYQMGFSRHTIRQYEQKGKASNVSWCAEHMQPQLLKWGVDPENVFITVIDADSWAPNIYFDEVESHILANLDNKFKFIYQPPQIFTRNHLEVPIITRIYDMMHGYAHHSNLFSVFNASFPLSNYTLSFHMIKKIGFWDTCADAIGEDFHTTMKSFWKTQGDVITVPIYSMFNQVNIQTGNGYFKDIQARFWQAERHARGVADVAYTFNMFVKQPFRWRTFLLGFQVLEMFILPAIVPWAAISMQYQKYILYSYTKRSPELFSQESVSWIYNSLGIVTVLAIILYFLLKRRTTTVLYGLENQSIFRIIQIPLIFFVNMFLVSVPTFTIAAFGTLFEGRQYIVADKVISKKHIDE